MKQYDKWSIWKANLDPVRGSEQGKTRPVIVISETSINEILPVVNVLPITSRKPGRKIYPNEYFIQAGSYGLNTDSIVLCYQIRTLDKSRLENKYGTINEYEVRDSILDGVCLQLGINQRI